MGEFSFVVKEQSKETPKNNMADQVAGGGMSQNQKIALGAGAAVAAGAAAVGLIGAVGAGGYMLHKSHESKKQDASTLRLHCKAISASGLKAGDWGGKSDPYVVFQVGDVKKSSGTVEKTVNPTWNDELEMGIYTEHLKTNVSIEVYDEDFGKDDSLGKTSVPFAQIPRDSWKEFELGLTEQGTLKVAFKVTGKNFQPDS